MSQPNTNRHNFCVCIAWPSSLCRSSQVLRHLFADKQNICTSGRASALAVRFFRSISFVPPPHPPLSTPATRWHCCLLRPVIFRGSLTSLLLPLQPEARARASSDGARANKKHKSIRAQKTKRRNNVTYSQMRQSKSMGQWPPAHHLLTSSATCSKYRAHPPPSLSPHSRGC